MELLSMDRDETVSGWRALVKAQSGGMIQYCDLLKRDAGTGWMLVFIDDIRVEEVLPEDLPIHAMLEEARLEREAGIHPGVTDRERRRLIG